MSQSMSTLDFFLIEGADLLEQLDALVQTPAGTFLKGDEFLRVARAYRGSAVMGGQIGLARAGQSLEACARALREGRLEWTDGARAEIVRAVDDLKVLMRRLRTPDPKDTEQAEAIASHLERLSGRPSAAMRAAAGPSLDAGARAFVAREAAGIASVLQQAAKALRGEGAGKDALAGIAPAMSALRGVAVLNDLPPLGDILAAIDNATRDASAGVTRHDAPDVLDVAARALARAAREVVDASRPDPGSDEARAFAARLLLTLRGATVDVASLFYDDAGPHIVHKGAEPAKGPARDEMVSQGEYLNAAAADIARSTTPVEKDLRLYGIAVGLRPMMTAAGSPSADALGRFAAAGRDAVGRGAASAAGEAFLTHVRLAAQALTGAQHEEEQRLAARLGQAADALLKMSAPEPVIAPAAAASAPAAIAAPAAPAAPAPAPAPRAPAAAAPPRPVPAATPAGAPLGEADLATSYLTLEQLIADNGIPLGSLDELVKGGIAVSPGVPAAARRATHQLNAMAPPAREPPIVPVASLAPDEAGVVPVEALVYSGDAARQRLRELKAELDAATRAKDASVPELIREVFDLVEQGLGDGR